MNHDNRLDVLWAPWRYDYIQSPDAAPTVSPIASSRFSEGADPDCFLCQAAACDSQQERERHVIHRRTHVVTLLNRFPYNNGHLLITPQRHLSDLAALSPAEWSEINDELVHWTAVIRKVMNADGFNIGLNLGRVAGAGLPGHLHWHVVPRWNGDTNFMTTIASSKTIPQSLDSLCSLLRENLPSL